MKTNNTTNHATVNETRLKSQFLRFQHYRFKRAGLVTMRNFNKMRRKNESHDEKPKHIAIHPTRFWKFNPPWQIMIRIKQDIITTKSS